MLVPDAHTASRPISIFEKTAQETWFQDMMQWSVYFEATCPNSHQESPDSQPSQPVKDTAGLALVAVDTNRQPYSRHMY